jgi:MFS transporter, DHA1 family, tetracycline resistance protein
MVQSRTFFFLPIFSTVFIDFMGLALVVPIFAPLLLTSDTVLSPEVSLSDRGVILGFLTACYPLGQFLGSPILGKLSDRHGRRPWLLISLAITVLAYAISAIGILVHSVAWMFVGRFTCGFMGGNGSIAQSAVADLAEEEIRAVYFGYLGLAMGLGFVLGPVIGGRLADPQLVSWFGWDVPFWFSALLAGINTLLVFLFFKETLQTKQRVKISLLDHLKSMGRAFTMGRLTALFGVFFFFVTGWFFFAQFFQVYLIQKFGYDQSQIGDTYTYIGLTYAFFQGALSGPVSRRFPSRTIVLISLFCLIFVFLALLIPRESWMLYIVYPFISLFVCLAWPNILALVSRMASRENQGEILGINQGIQSLAQGIAPIASGPMVATHRSLPTFFASGGMAIAWLILFFALRPSKFSEEERSKLQSPSLPPSPPPRPPDSTDQKRPPE